MTCGQNITFFRGSARSEALGHTNSEEGLNMRMVLLGGAVLAAFAAGPAGAADLPVRGPVYKSAPPVVYNWTGFYGGVNVGYSWGQHTNEWTVNPAFFTVSEVPEHERRRRRRSVGLQLADRQLGDRHGIGLQRVRPERQHDLLRHRGLRHHRSRRSQAAVVRHVAHAPRLPAVAVRPALCHRRSRLRPGEVGLFAVHRRRRRRAR